MSAEPQLLDIGFGPWNPVYHAEYEHRCLVRDRKTLTTYKLFLSDPGVAEPDMEILEGPRCEIENCPSFQFYLRTRLEP